ncbi:hypothetical protein LMG28727_07367 [Paraburkholderia kirstenboschensis]|uniref:hypothetical protein n=1 Tax=Paraburkholderia kirstenboschensis TaxID=1245436 RepID=UPI000AEFD5D2|nr:hypothetical protein [Paraburkholderia kirstenboschensis]CAD6561231.1 hypothetical protein LMG28727_07367 [Paraburkholderia kirstenboschensis]
MAATNVIIIVPSQGKDVGAFLAVGQALVRKVYGGRAKVIRTKVTISDAGATTDASATTVNFETADGGAFSWSDAHDLRTLITISHGFSGDGPNLGYGLGDSRFQVWARDESDASGLSKAAQNFWGRDVGKALLKPDGKVILVGCFMGAGDYARNVAKAAKVSTYGSTGLIGAGNEHTTLKYVGAIERGRVLAPMVEAKP